jgi:predicted ester cyclase
MMSLSPFAAVFHDHVGSTSTGDFMGVPPNNKRIAWTEIHFLRIVDNKIVAYQTNFDQFKILMQLGQFHHEKT